MELCGDSEGRGDRVMRSSWESVEEWIAALPRDPKGLGGIGLFCGGMGTIDDFSFTLASQEHIRNTRSVNRWQSMA